MSCPLFVDFTRECLSEVEELPGDTFGFCTTERYTECPFYRKIRKIGRVCEYAAKCPVYRFFQAGDFEKFVAMTGRYCLSENNVRCHRYVMKKKGEAVPENLLPDGRMIGEPEKREGNHE